MSALTVNRCGIALIQDKGRTGYEHLGVPGSGAFNAQRYRDAVALLDLGNTPVIEIITGTFGATIDTTVQVAVVGDDVAIDINGSAMGPNMVFELDAHAAITITPATTSGPVYFAVRGLTAPTVLGSSATDTMTRLGPDPLRAGTTLDVQLSTDEPYLVGRFLLPRRSGHLRSFTAVPGPHLPLADISFTVTSVARSGVRLRPNSDLASEHSGSIPSLPVVPGAIQVTPSGEVIILGPDAGVTGGYPLMGVLTAAALDNISHLRPGDQLRFRATPADRPPLPAKSSWVVDPVRAFF